MKGTERIRCGKEIGDIVSERDTIQRLINEADWDKLSTYLQELNTKYRIEAFVYNVANPIPPKNIQENAQNCISFLNTLLATKSVDAARND